MEQWYKVVVAMAYQGAGKYRDTTNYVYANNVSEIFERCRRMPSIKRSHTPNIEPISREEAVELEKRIVINGINLQRTKEIWYFGTRK